jgi:DNA repair protein RadC
MTLPMTSSQPVTTMDAPVEYGKEEDEARSKRGVLMDPHTSILRDLPSEGHIYERFLAGGPGALTTAELLGIILRTGTPEESAVQTAARLLSEMGSLRDLAQADVETLSGIPGIGTIKAIEIRAALELGKRLVALGDGGVRPTVRTPADAVNFLMPELRHQSQEHFKVVLLDSKNQIIRAPTITVGTVNASLIHPREVFRPALAQPCVSVILAHNHPSGDPTPSREDLEVTQQLVSAGRVLGIDVLDHVILGDGRFVSLKERDMM